MLRIGEAPTLRIPSDENKANGSRKYTDYTEGYTADELDVIIRELDRRILELTVRRDEAVHAQERLLGFPG